MSVIKKHIVYAGINDPQTVNELKVEICGLKNLIKIAEELISRYEQVLSIINLTAEEEFYASQTSGARETEKSEDGNREKKE